jgi:hypothetical protein
MVPRSIASLTLNMLDAAGWTIVHVTLLQRYPTVDDHAMLCVITANRR